MKNSVEEMFVPAHETLQQNNEEPSSSFSELGLFVAFNTYSVQPAIAEFDRAVAAYNQKELLNSNIGVNISPARWFLSKNPDGTLKYKTIGKNGRTFITSLGTIEEIFPGIKPNEFYSVGLFTDLRKSQFSYYRTVKAAYKLGYIGIVLDKGVLGENLKGLKAYSCGFKTTLVNNIQEMGAACPISGNIFFRGPGMGLPNQAPELTVMGVSTESSLKPLPSQAVTKISNPIPKQSFSIKLSGWLNANLVFYSLAKKAMADPKNFQLSNEAKDLFIEMESYATLAKGLKLFSIPVIISGLLPEANKLHHKWRTESKDKGYLPLDGTFTSPEEMVACLNAMQALNTGFRNMVEKLKSATTFDASFFEKWKPHRNLSSNATFEASHLENNTNLSFKVNLNDKLDKNPKFFSIGDSLNNGMQSLSFTKVVDEKELPSLPASEEPPSIVEKNEQQDFLPSLSEPVSQSMNAPKSQTSKEIGKIVPRVSITERGGIGIGVHSVDNGLNTNIGIRIELEGISEIVTNVVNRAIDNTRIASGILDKFGETYAWWVDASFKHCKIRVRNTSTGETEKTEFKWGGFFSRIIIDYEKHLPTINKNVSTLLEKLICIDSNPKINDLIKKSEEVLNEESNNPTIINNLCEQWKIFSELPFTREIVTKLILKREISTFQSERTPRAINLDDYFENIPATMTSEEAQFIEKIKSQHAAHTASLLSEMVSPQINESPTINGLSLHLKLSNKKSKNDLKDLQSGINNLQGKPISEVNESNVDNLLHKIENSEGLKKWEKRGETADNITAIDALYKKLKSIKTYILVRDELREDPDFLRILELWRLRSSENYYTEMVFKAFYENLHKNLQSGNVAELQEKIDLLSALEGHHPEIQALITYIKRAFSETTIAIRQDIEDYFTKRGAIKKQDSGASEKPFATAPKDPQLLENRISSAQDKTASPFINFFELYELWTEYGSDNSVLNTSFLEIWLPAQYETCVQLEKSAHTLFKLLIMTELDQSSTIAQALNSVLKLHELFPSFISYQLLSQILPANNPSLALANASNGFQWKTGLIHAGCYMTRRLGYEIAPLQVTEDALSIYYAANNVFSSIQFVAPHLLNQISKDYFELYDELPESSALHFLQSPYLSAVMLFLESAFMSATDPIHMFVNYFSGICILRGLFSYSLAEAASNAQITNINRFISKKKFNEAMKRLQILRDENTGILSENQINDIESIIYFAKGDKELFLSVTEDLSIFSDTNLIALLRIEVLLSLNNSLARKEVYQLLPSVKSRQDYHQIMATIAQQEDFYYASCRHTALGAKPQPLPKPKDNIFSFMGALSTEFLRPVTKFLLTNFTTPPLLEKECPAPILTPDENQDSKQEFEELEFNADVEGKNTKILSSAALDTLIFALFSSEKEKRHAALAQVNTYISEVRYVLLNQLDKNRLTPELDSPLSYARGQISFLLLFTDGQSKDKYRYIDLCIGYGYIPPVEVYILSLAGKNVTEFKDILDLYQFDAWSIDEKIELLIGLHTTTGVNENWYTRENLHGIIRQIKSTTELNLQLVREVVSLDSRDFIYNQLERQYSPIINNIKHLLQQGADPNQISHYDCSKGISGIIQTDTYKPHSYLVHHIVLHQSPELLRIFKLYGANFNQLNIFDMNPLEWLLAVFPKGSPQLTADRIYNVLSCYNWNLDYSAGNFFSCTNLATGSSIFNVLEAFQQLLFMKGSVADHKPGRHCMPQRYAGWSAREIAMAKGIDLPYGPYNVKSESLAENKTCAENFSFKKKNDPEKDLPKFAGSPQAFTTKLASQNSKLINSNSKSLSGNYGFIP